MRKINIFLFTFIFLLAAVTGCSATKQSNKITATTPTLDVSSIIFTNFNLPDKIVAYKNGSIIELSKKDKLYLEILKLSDKRIDPNSGALKMGIRKEGIDNLKKTGIVIEFEYSEPQEKLGHMERKYSGLIFPLTGHYIGYCFFEDNTNFYGGPIHGLSVPDDLLELLN